MSFILFHLGVCSKVYLYYDTKLISNIISAGLAVAQPPENGHTYGKMRILNSAKKKQF